jgi:hypothetical protein
MNDEVEFITGDELISMLDISEEELTEAVEWVNLNFRSAATASNQGTS